MPEQLAKQERQRTHIRRQNQESHPLEDDGGLDTLIPDSLRYVMASSTQNHTDLVGLLADNSNDPATKVMHLGRTLSYNTD